MKPGNVLVSPEGEAKLSDLGLAGPLEVRGERPSLRQDRGNGRLPLARPDPRSAASHAGLGHLFAGLHALLRGDRQGAVSRRHDGGQGPGALRIAALDPRRLNPLSPEFVEVMADMMAKEPGERIASARDVIARLAPSWPPAPRPADKPDSSSPPMPTPVLRDA